MLLWLYGGNDANAAGAEKAAGKTSQYTAQGALDQFKQMKDAMETFVFPKFDPTDPKKFGEAIKTWIDNINEAATAQESYTRTLQRSMGGVSQLVDKTNEFGRTIQKAYYGEGGDDGLLNIGMTFKETTELVEGLVGGMGRMTPISRDVVQNMGEIAKATGMASKDVGALVAQMDLFNYSQKESIEKIHDLSKEARQVGLSAKGYVTEISKNMKNVNGFGFKAGVDGLAKMVKQSQQLRTSMEAIGAMKTAETALDPEGAIELAANFQMLGGAVGKLADPFQLMYMAQNDVAGLQEELVKSTKASMTFNKETGNFDIATEDLYRLRQQAKLTGANLEDLVSTGRQAAKLDFIKEKFDLSGIDPASQDLIAGLAQIGKNGEVTVDIPGFDEQGKTLEEALKMPGFKEAMTEYQKNAAKSEKEIAVESMTISENQARDINVIKEAVMTMLGDSGRKELEKNIKDLTKEQGKTFGQYGKDLADLDKRIPGVVDEKARQVTEGLPDTLKTLPGYNITKDTMDATITGIQNMDPADILELLGIPSNPMQDGFFPASGPPMLLSQGQLFKGIIGDQVAVGPDLDKALNNMGMSGKIDINLNIGGSINGDGGVIAQMFQRPEVQKQIMDTVLYKLDAYKKTKGVLA